MHTSRQFARRAAAHKRPCALVFADLVKAFDRVLRAVVIGDVFINCDVSSGKSVRERWSEAGVPANVVDEAIAYVRMTGGVLSEANLHPGVLHLLRDLHDGTWFQLDGGYLIETNLGSRQGCKFGAVIFNLMYCRALDDLRLALRNEGLLSVFSYCPDAAPWCHMACKKDGTPLVTETYEMCDITYVDDECLCLDAGSNDELLEKLPRVLDIMQSVFTCHFLELNWKPLKTECVLRLVGRGVKRAWKSIERSAAQLAAAGPGAAKHVCCTPGGIECNIVPCYKHVGSLVDGLGRLECELQARIAAANRVYQPLAKKLMSAKYLDSKTKAQLFLSLVLSVLLYGCETWPEPTQAQGKKLEAFQMKCLRRLAGEPRVPIPGHVRISDVELRRQLCIPSIESQICRARLRYAASLINVTQPSVASLLGVGQRAPADWAAMLLGDLEALREVCPLFANLGDPSTDWERWRTLLVTPVGDRAIRLCLKCESCWYEAPSVHTVDMASGCVSELPENALLCPECPNESVRVFLSEGARQAHRARAHGHRATARDFVVDERCPACNKTFGSRPMAIEHLQCRAQRCRRMMLDGMLPRPSAAAIADADNLDRKRGLTKCTKARFVV